MGNQDHHGDVGEAASDACEEVEDEDGNEPRAVPDEDHADGEKDEAERDRLPAPPSLHEKGGHGDGGQVPGEIPGPDEPHLVVAQGEGLPHRGEQHANRARPRQEKTVSPPVKTMTHP